LFRIEAGVTMRQNFGLVDLRFSYFDSVNTRIGIPTNNVDTLAKIRGINVYFIAASPEPVIGAAGDTTYAMVNWQKLMFPRNLNQLNLSK
jgi:hypothetical protein